MVGPCMRPYARTAIPASAITAARTATPVRTGAAKRMTGTCPRATMACCCVLSVITWLVALPIPLRLNPSRPFGPRPGTLARRSQVAVATQFYMARSGRWRRLLAGPRPCTVHRQLRGQPPYAQQLRGRQRRLEPATHLLSRHRRGALDHAALLEPGRQAHQPAEAPVQGGPVAPRQRVAPRHRLIAEHGPATPPQERGRHAARDDPEAIPGQQPPL